MTEEKCDHICTSNCRREGCNCECGEYHVDRFWGKSLAQIALEEKYMKYKLKRDLPWAKAGTICEVVAQERCLNGSYLMKDTVSQKEFTAPYATFSDWFEEVDERWKPAEFEVYYFVGTECNVEYLKWEKYVTDEDRYKVGNCFKTMEEAQRAAEQIKALLKEFHKNNP